MKQVLITYTILEPGFFSHRQYHSSEIIDVKEGQSVGEAVKADLEKWKTRYRFRDLAIAVKDYKVIE